MSTSQFWSNMHNQHISLDEAHCLLRNRKWMFESHHSLILNSALLRPSPHILVTSDPAMPCSSPSPPHISTTWPLSAHLFPQYHQFPQLLPTAHHTSGLFNPLPANRVAFLALQFPSFTSLTITPVVDRLPVSWLCLLPGCPVCVLPTTAHILALPMVYSCLLLSASPK